MPKKHTNEEAMYHMDRNAAPLVAALREEIEELEAKIERFREVGDDVA